MALFRETKVIHPPRMPLLATDRGDCAKATKATEALAHLGD